MSGRVGAFAAAGLLAMVLACGPSAGMRRADDLYAAGSYAEAGAAYEDEAPQGDLTALPDGALFRMGAAFAAPSNPRRDVKRAVEALSILRRRRADAPYVQAAGPLLALLEKETQRERELAAARESLAQAQQAWDAAQKRETEMEAELVLLRQQVEDQAVALQKLRDELEALKQIDLRRRR